MDLVIVLWRFGLMASGVLTHLSSVSLSMACCAQIDDVHVWVYSNVMRLSAPPFLLSRSGKHSEGRGITVNTPTPLPVSSVCKHPACCPIQFEFPSAELDIFFALRRKKGTI